MDGVLVIDKPAGPTSHDIVDRVRRSFRLRRVGHTGTLDPFATGVLPLCLGKATRLARFLGVGEKVYRATIRLGFATSTDDLTGTPVAEAEPFDVDEEEIRAGLTRLEGSYDQVPPAYSAKKVGGRRAYSLAREGRAPVLAPVPVTVARLEAELAGADRVRFTARVSAGTYLRVLAEEMGRTWVAPPTWRS